MSGGANIVEQYAGADVPARIELLSAKMFTAR